MKEQIETKIEEILQTIINKPANEITMDDYSILSSELRDIRFREDSEANRIRMAELLSMANGGFASVSGHGNVK